MILDVLLYAVDDLPPQMSPADRWVTARRYALALGNNTFLVEADRNEAYKQLDAAEGNR